LRKAGEDDGSLTPAFGEREMRQLFEWLLG